MESMERYDLVPRRGPGGSLVLEAVPVSPVERMRRALRRLLRRP